MIKNCSFHIIGVGGIGMSAIANILLSWGCKVSGSDIRRNKQINRLVDLGMEFYLGHREKNIGDCDFVVRSSAIPDSNIEILRSIALKKNLVSRAEVSKIIVKNFRQICISGSHGKTTITSMLGYLFHVMNFEPMIICGGIMKNFDSNVVLGDGDLAIIESDESDGTFVELPRFAAIVSNISNDHLTNYGNSEENLYKFFQNFVENIDFNGFCVFCIDCKSTKKLYKNNKKNRKYFSYSVLDKGADFFANNIKNDGLYIQFDLFVFGSFFESVKIASFGLYNVSNALAALCSVWACGADLHKATNLIEGYKGTDRRLTKIGDVGGINFYNDYAHHPNEVRAVVESASNLVAKEKGANLVVIFQPHKFSRLKDCFYDYVGVLSSLENIVLKSVFSAGEKQEDYSLDSKDLYLELSKVCKNAIVSDDVNVVAEFIFSKIKKGIVLFIGAGDIDVFGRAVFERSSSIEFKNSEI